MVVPDDERSRMAEAVPGEAAVPAPDPAEELSPLALLLTGHVIQDGEIVLLLLKPSVWFVPLTATWAIALAAIIALAPRVFPSLPGHAASYVNVAVLLCAGRLTWATVQWMGRYYILTDRRVMTLTGVFATQVYQCPLRKVARVRVLRTIKERLFALGSIELIPSEEDIAVGMWQTVARPRDVREKIQRAVAKAKGSGRGA